MPAKSQAQRKFLNWKFGHGWVKKHHFDTKGALPARAAHAIHEPAHHEHGFHEHHIHEPRLHSHGAEE